MNVFFSSWASIGRIIIVVLLVYPGLILLLRLYGKRSLGKMNMFDFIITVAFGSTLASTILSKDVAIADGLLTFILLLTAQFLITWSAIRWEAVDRVIKSDPTLLYYDGNYVADALRRERVSKHEIIAEVRLAGHADMKEVFAVVLETTGEISVMGRNGAIHTTALDTVANYERATQSSS